MANFSDPAPFDATKPDWLHDRHNRPAAPARTSASLIRRFLPLAAGILFAIGLEALAFQTRATFEGERDWVVPTVTPFFAIGGVALAVLLARRQIIAVTPGLLLVVIACGLTAANIWRGQVTTGHDWGRDILSIVTGVVLAAALISLTVGVVWSEAKNPTRAPLSEV